MTNETTVPDLNFRCCGCGKIWTENHFPCECLTDVLYQRDGKNSRLKSVWIEAKEATALEAAQARIAELEGQNQRLLEDRARFPDRPDWVGDMIGAHYKNMEHRIESAERYTRQYEARLRMEQRKTKELIEALENIVTWGNAGHCTKLRSIARAALEGKG